MILTFERARDVIEGVIIKLLQRLFLSRPNKDKDHNPQLHQRVIGNEIRVELCLSNLPFSTFSFPFFSPSSIAFLCVCLCSRATHRERTIATDYSRIVEWNPASQGRVWRFYEAEGTIIRMSNVRKTLFDPSLSHDGM